MPNPIFQSMLSRYETTTKDERTNATHEVMQQITLAGLYKAGFFIGIVIYAAQKPHLYLILQTKTTSVARQYNT